MGNKIKFKRGIKSELPELSYGEPGFVSDEKELYIGTESGNVKLTSKSEIESINEQLDKKANEIFIESFDGVSDNEKINNAINSINKGIIKLKNKEYSFSNIILKEGISICGSENTVINAISDGIILKAINNSKISNLILNDNGFHIKAIDVGQIGGTGENYSNNCIVCDNKINLTNKNSSGIRIGYGKNNNVLNNTIINLKTIGTSNVNSIGIAIYSDYPLICENVFISNNYVNGFYKGISPWGTGTRIKVQVNNNIVENCDDVGIDMYHSTVSQVLNNTVYNCKVGIVADTTSYNDNRGRGTIINGNAVHKSSEIGIYCEELRGANITNNTIQDCDIGLYGGAGINYCNFSSNTLCSNRLGLMISNKLVPTLMVNYDNNSSVIKNNVITANKEHGIILCGVRGLWEISENYIVGNNTSNGNYYGIYFDKDVVSGTDRDRTCESFIIKNNTIFNANLDGSIGYQNGIYNNSGNISNVIIDNNYLNNYKTELFLTGINKYSIIKNNIVDSVNKSITIPTNIINVNNIGFNEGNVVVNKISGIMFANGLNSTNELPSPSMEHDGRMLKIERHYDTTSDDYIETEYYICNRQKGGGYKWCKIQLV